jgi:hypothetical protein
MPFIGNKPAQVPLTSADIADSIITSAKIVDGTIVNADINASAAIAGTKLSGITFPLAFKNGIINGDFAVSQRATSFTSSANNDDVYTLDRWYILSDGNDAIDVTQETTTVPTNKLTAIALDVETADKKFGIAQIIEQKNCVGLIGNTVTLSFKAKVSATTDLDNVKCAIVAWSGTADTVTSDIISAWGAEGTNPTLIADATYENTPANLNVTTSYATYSVTANVDTASTKNIIVFIWSDVTTVATGDFLYITDVQLEAGTTASDFEFLPIDVNLGRCQRYYYRITAETTNKDVATGFNSSTTEGRGMVFFPVQMRTGTTSLEQTGTAGDYGVTITNTTVTCSVVPSIRGTGNTPNSTLVVGQVASGLTAGEGSMFRIKTSGAYLGWSAEL